MPEVACKAPEVLKGYEVFEVDGIQVYIANSALKGTSQINFVLRGWFIFKEIVADGVRYPRI